MKLFQNSGISTTYRRRLDDLSRTATSFQARLQVFLNHRYAASHFLKPVLDGDPSAFFTNGDYEPLQRAWAREHGLPDTSSLDQILVAQLEAHRAEVFYNLDPVRFGRDFLRKLPSCVRAKICWRAAPSPGADFTGYDLVLCNFPSLLQQWRDIGLKAEMFFPAHDPVMDGFASAADRPVDVLFAGGYSRHHVRRGQILEAAARLADRHKVVFCLDRSRFTRLAESPLGLLPPLRRHRRPESIRRVSEDPVFGLDLYKRIGCAKIVLNGAIDMAGEDRGNMRCFEAMGCGALLVSDRGRYPRGMTPGVNMLQYDSEQDVERVLSDALADWERNRQRAEHGRDLVRTEFSKAAQWESFCKLVEGIR